MTLTAQLLFIVFPPSIPLYLFFVQTVDISALIHFTNETVVHVVLNAGIAQFVRPESGVICKEYLRVSQALHGRVRLRRKVPRVVEKLLHAWVGDVVVLRKRPEES